MTLNVVCVRYKSSTREPPEELNKNSKSIEDERFHRELKRNALNVEVDNVYNFKKSNELQPKPKLSSNINITVPESTTSAKPEDWNDILNRWYTKYQDFIGITDLKRAQDRVTELSEGLLDTQSRRRSLQAEIEQLQEQLTLNHQRITKAELYSEEHQRLFDQARDMSSRLKEVRFEFESCEQLERDTFTQLSAAIRDCHERERTQAEQSKYWSIIASIISAALASVITSVNNWVRIREIKDHVSSNNQQLLEGYQKMHEDVVGAVSSSRPESVSVVGWKGGANSEGSKDDNLSQSALVDGDVVNLNSAILDVFKKQITGALSSETKNIQETVNTRLDAINSKLQAVVEGNRKLANLIISDDMSVEDANSIRKLSKEVAEMSEMKTVVVDYSYRHIATAMAVGAGIGTLATAFFLGSFSGGSI
ncbi:hypothetical protein SK128_018990 [Halocaridina rubra]|uniref:Uncharacterized protein n=2 Tax=Halocaridina rubra TaxID=373956 RepID=A0AAN8WWH4_HALRR